MTVEPRTERLVLPDCPLCAAPRPTVMSRTLYVLYIRCDSCLHFWSVMKPRYAATLGRSQSDQTPTPGSRD